MNDIMKIVKSLEESGILIKGINETFKNEAIEQKGRFLCIYLGTFGASLLGNMLTGKGTSRSGEAQIEQVKNQLEQDRVFNAASSFSKFWNTKVSSKWT